MSTAIRLPAGELHALHAAAKRLGVSAPDLFAHIVRDWVASEEAGFEHYCMKVIVPADAAREIAARAGRASLTVDQFLDCVISRALGQALHDPEAFSAEAA